LSPPKSRELTFGQTKKEDSFEEDYGNDYGVEESSSNAGDNKLAALNDMLKKKQF